MLDLGLWEIIVILGVALLVIKPEDVPSIVRSLYQVIAKIKAIAAEFSTTVSDISHEVSVHEMTKIIGDDGKEYVAYEVEKPDPKKEEDDGS